METNGRRGGVGFAVQGMSFCPTPSPNPQELTGDVFEFTRKLRLKYHFRNVVSKDESIVKLTSNFNPAPNANAELEKVIHDIEHMPISVRKKGVHSNM